MARILVVDDEPNLRQVIATVLRARGYQVNDAPDAEAGLSLHATHGADAAVLDLYLPGMSGLEAFQRLRLADPDLPCIFITAQGSVRSAVEAMRNGAYDYISKPFDNDELLLTIERALERRKLTRRVVELEEDLSARSDFAGIVGRSHAIRHVLRRLAKVAGSDATVLLSGETGTGKELAARSIHAQSPRASGPFVAVNCGTIPATLAESQLFGHVRGAFTDARTEHHGYFEQADTGTLFLDEVGDLPLDLQVKLLRALQEHQIVRVGAEHPTPVRIRLIVATNRDLNQDVRAGRFRSDLFWRLNVFQIEMPALRQRREDLPLLTQHLLGLVNAECRAAATGVHPAVAERFADYPWPGNVRELENVLKHAVVMAETPILQLSDLPDYLLVPSAVTPLPIGSGATLEEALADTERRLVEATLERFRGNRSEAAAALGIDRRTLFTKLRRYSGAAKDPAD